MKPSLAHDLAALSPAEKLRVMESLWTELEHTPASIPSPAWHGEVLEERAAAYRGGQVGTRDLDTIKSTLRAGRQ